MMSLSTAKLFLASLQTLGDNLHNCIILQNYIAMFSTSRELSFSLLTDIDLQAPIKRIYLNIHIMYICFMHECTIFFWGGVLIPPPHTHIFSNQIITYP